MNTQTLAWIAQGIFSKYLMIDDDDATGMRNGGFGSTGE